MKKPKRPEPFTSPADAEREAAIERLRFGEPQQGDAALVRSEERRAIAKKHAAEIQIATKSDPEHSIFEEPDLRALSASVTLQAVDQAINPTLERGAKAKASTHKGGIGRHREGSASATAESIRARLALLLELEKKAKAQDIRRSDRWLADKIAKHLSMPPETVRTWLKKHRRAGRP